MSHVFQAFIPTIAHEPCPQYRDKRPEIQDT